MRARTAMRKIRDVLRLRWVLSLSYRQIGRSLKIGHGTVGDYVMRAQAVGLGWDEVEGMDEEALECKLFPAELEQRSSARPLPDWAEVHRDMRRKGVTLALLWQEYREDHPGGYGYSRFCELYRLYEGRLDIPLRQDHKAGERMFVDYAGLTVEIRDRTGGQSREAQIFVAALGASQLIYAESGPGSPKRQHHVAGPGPPIRTPPAPARRFAPAVMTRALTW